jgi:hypothetical protein
MNEHDDTSGDELRSIDGDDPNAYQLLGGPSSPRADRGVAGSLRQELDRIRGLDPNRRRRPYYVAGYVLAAAASIAISLGGLIADRTALYVIGLLMCLVVAASLPIVTPRLFGASEEHRLCHQISKEKLLSKVLDDFTVQGWHVLHDRLVPDSAHRIPFLLVGGAGIFPVSIIEDPEPLMWNPDQDIVYTAKRGLVRWFQTRAWERDQLARGIGGGVVVWPIAVHMPPKPVGLPVITSRGVALTNPATIGSWIRDHANTLSREQVALLAAQVEVLCPPAAARDER